MNKKALIIISIIVYILAGASLPFIKQPDVSDEYKNKFDIKKFYKNSSCNIYARPIRDNEIARIEKIRAINNAKNSIILSSYRLLADKAGEEFLGSLIDAAERGVEIKIILDGNTLVLNAGKNNYLKALDMYDNVEIKIYNPMRLTRPWTLMGRMHDKYMIVDNELVFLGGRNIENRFLYNDTTQSYDWDIIAYFNDREDDDFISQLEDYFYNIYNNGKRNFYLDEAVLFPSNRNKQSKRDKLLKNYRADKLKSPKKYEEIDYKENLIKVNNINLIKNPIGIYTKEPTAFYDISMLLLNANENVIIHTPYIISNNMMNEKTSEIGKNANTMIFTNSAYNNANLIGAGDFILNKSNISDLGVKLLLNNRDNSYHGKAFIIDDNISAIGSFNWDMRSVYVDTELMMVVNGEDFNSNLQDEFKFYHDDSVLILDNNEYDFKNEEYKDASFIKKLVSILLVIILYPFRFLF